MALKVQVNLLLFGIYLLITRGDCKKTVLRIKAPTCNDEFELPNDSFLLSYIEDCIKWTIQNHRILATISPTHVYIKRINELLNEYKL